MTDNQRDHDFAAARHAAATAWCQDDTTMPEVDAFGAGWDAALAAVMPVADGIAVQRAADELDLAAVLTVSGQDTAEEIREALFRRANALRATAVQR